MLHDMHGRLLSMIATVRLTMAQALVAHLAAAGGPRLLDVQWSTPHLQSLGSVEVGRAEYHELLDRALTLPDAWSEASGA